MLDSMKLRTKIVLLVLVAFLGLAVNVVLNALAVKDDLMDARKLQVRSVVEASVQIAAAYHARAAAGASAPAGSPSRNRLPRARGGR